MNIQKFTLNNSSIRTSSKVEQQVQHHTSTNQPKRRKERDKNYRNPRMTLIPIASRSYRAAARTAVFTKNLQSFSWNNSSTNMKRPSYQLCFLSSREPPSSREEHRAGKHSEGQNYTSNDISNTSKRLKNPKRKESRQIRRRKQQQQQKQRESNEYSSSLVQHSQYSYRRNSASTSAVSWSSSTIHKKKKNPNTANIMQSMNASALLDPLNYCKGSPHVNNNASRSISGTDAARRLLRGKKDFLLAARTLNSEPVLLNGHGVPPALFQHCVDMADALLRHYGPDAVECSFHNYNNENNDNNSNSKVPLHLRVRRKDSTNSCLPPPSSDDANISNGEDNIGRNNGNIDWDHNLTLYLTVMERLAKSLGQVLKLSSIDNGHNQLGTIYNDDDDDDDDDGTNFTSSPLLFPPPRRPRWNVDILRGAYFDFQPIRSGGVLNHLGRSSEQNQNDVKRNEENEKDDVDLDERVTTAGKESNIPPSPIVEFIQQNSSSSGHVLIRLQGCARPNGEFGDSSSRQPLTLVFDACFQNPSPMISKHDTS